MTADASAARAQANRTGSDSRPRSTIESRYAGVVAPRRLDHREAVEQPVEHHLALGPGERGARGRSGCRTRSSSAAGRPARRRSGRGRRTTRGSRFAAPSSVITSSPASTATPCTSTASKALRPSSCTGLSHRSSSSTAAAEQRAVVPQALQLVGVLEQREQPVADEVGGGLEAGAEEEHHGRQQLVVARAGRPPPRRGRARRAGRRWGASRRCAISSSNCCDDARGRHRGGVHRLERRVAARASRPRPARAAGAPRVPPPARRASRR